MRLMRAVPVSNGTMERLIDMPRRCSSASQSEIVEPSSTRPVRLTAPVRKASASAIVQSFRTPCRPIQRRCGFDQYRILPCFPLNRVIVTIISMLTVKVAESLFQVSVICIPIISYKADLGISADVCVFGSEDSDATAQSFSNLVKFTEIAPVCPTDRLQVACHPALSVCHAMAIFGMMRSCLNIEKHVFICTYRTLLLVRRRHGLPVSSLEAACG